MNGKIMMMIGLPGSGKSQYIEKNAGKDAVILSSDKIREEIFGDENIQNEPGKVFNTLFKRLKEAMNNKKEEIYIDATNVSLKDRRKAFNIIRSLNKNILKPEIAKEIKESKGKFNIDLSTKESKKKYFDKFYDIIGINFEINLDTIIERDLKRERTVGKKVIFRMLSRFMKPSLGEGFDEIKVVDENEEKVDNVGFVGNENFHSLQKDKQKIFISELIKFLNGENNLNSVLKNDKYLSCSLDCEQTSKWHKETLFEHLKMILQNLQTNNKILKLITIFHDIGKPFTKETKKNNLLKRGYEHIGGPKFKKKSGEIVEIDNYKDFQFLGHENFSANIFRLNYKKILVENKIISENEAELIEIIIRGHLHFHESVGEKNIEIDDVIYGENTEVFQIGTFFSWCDRKVRIGEK